MRRFFPLLLALLALPLRAQYDLTPSAQIQLPTGNSYIIGLTTFGGASFFINTVDEIYLYPLAGPLFTKVGSYRFMSIRPTPGSQVGVVPGTVGFWQTTTFNNDDTPSLFTTRQSPPNQIYQVFPSAWDDLPRAMALTAGGQAYFLDQNSQLWRASNYQDLTTTTRLTDSIGNGNVGHLSLGADGSVYALDSNNEVYRFSADGSLLNHYTLSDAQNFLVSSSGVLFSMNASGNYGGIYNAVTGASLGRYSFNAGDINDPKSQGGVSSMVLVDNSVTNTETLVALTGTGKYAWTYDVTGVSAIPEPSTYAAIAGACALGLAALRKRSAPTRRVGPAKQLGLTTPRAGATSGYV